MRWLIWALVLANAGYFAWRLRHLEPEPPRGAPAVTPGPAAVNRLLLLSEVDPGELRERRLAERADAGGEDGAPAPAGGTAAPAGFAGTCASIGPLAAEADPAPVRAWLARRGAITVLREGQRREVALYWVYFPPLPSRAEAIARVEEMRERGIDDIYIIPRGDQANAVSLGVYSRRTSLERRLAELRANGYEPSIAPRYRTRRATWLDAALPTGAALPEADLAARFPDLEVRAAPCTAELARLAAAGPGAAGGAGDGAEGPAAGGPTAAASAAGEAAASSPPAQSQESPSTLPDAAGAAGSSSSGGLPADTTPPREEDLAAPPPGGTAPSESAPPLGETPPEGGIPSGSGAADAPSAPAGAARDTPTPGPGATRASADRAPTDRRVGEGRRYLYSDAIGAGPAPSDPPAAGRD